MKVPPVRALASPLVVALLLAACGGEEGAPDASTDLGPGLDRPTADAPTEAAVDARPRADVPRVDVPSGPTCAPLSIVPSSVRLATGQGLALAVAGGAGTGAVFSLPPTAMTGGATLSPGGALMGGGRAARFEVIASDLVCGLTARASVEVVGPFVVVPERVRLTPGRTVRFQATGNLGAVRWQSLVAPPSGDGRLDAAAGTFTAGNVLGSYFLRAQDTGSGEERPLVVEVARTSALAPAIPNLAVASGSSVRLDWRGGSGLVTAAITAGSAGGAITTSGNAVYYSAEGARPGSLTITATDRFTMERATVRVIVGEEVAPTPIVRGPTALGGDVALGDVNGDGRADLVVGHANRNARGVEAGGVLVYLANATGGFATRPEQVIEGGRDLDHYGAVLRVADLDGDRRDDVLVASPDQDLGRDGRGGVGFYLGGATGGLVTPAERVFSGEAQGHRYGAAVVLDDLNADRVTDLVVAAPNATNTFLTGCANNGRVYVYHGQNMSRGLFQTVPVQVLDLVDRLDDTDGPAQCRTGGMDAGRALALIDLDGDRRRDLAVGAPGLSSQTDFYGSVLVFRGLDRGRFEDQPAWVIHLAAAQQVAGARFGAALDVVPTGTSAGDVLVVRSPSYGRDLAGATASQAGGLWVFRSGSLGPRAATSTHLKVVTSSVASARFTGAANEGAGRSAAVGDVDGDGAADYVLGGASTGARNGVLRVFTAAALGGTGALVPAASVAGEDGEFLGSALAIGSVARGMAAPVAVWSAYRNTAQGLSLGAVHVVPSGRPGAFAERWRSRTTLELQGFPAWDRAGTQVALGRSPSGAGADVVVGSPGANSPAVPAMGTTPARPAGYRIRMGSVDVVPPTVRAPSARLWVDRDSAGLGASFAVTDFNGDGRYDLAVGDPGMTAGGADMIRTGVASTATDPCLMRTGTTVAARSAGGRGVVRVYLQQTDGSFSEAFWVLSRETVPSGGTFRRGGLGSLLGGGFDVNNDGFEDLVVGRSGGTTTNGAEVVLGRAADAMGRIVIVCGDPATGAWWPETAGTSVYGRSVAGLGDLDGDGCDEVAASYAGGGRAAVSVRFGFGPRCGAMHTRPWELTLVPDDRALRDNVVGDATSQANDTLDLAGAATGFGAVVAGPGDVTGDRVPDLLVRDTALNWRDTAGPAVEVISGALLVRQCPARTCADGLTGAFWTDEDAHVLGIRAVDPPDRMIIPAFDVTTARFGSALGGADLDGDGVAEVVVGAADASLQGEFSGAVAVWRGRTDQETLAGPPWLLAVGDATEPSGFGAACAALAVPSGAGAGGWLSVGAPLSSHRGASTGAAYRWRIER